MKQLGQFLRRQWILLIIVGLVIVASTIRLRMYGDLRLSMANHDTATYVDSSKVNLLSWEAFTGRRLFTTNMMYQLLKPDGDYHILVNGSQNTRNRRVQPDFVGIVYLHIMLSLICWGVLTITLTSLLKNSFLRILAAILILLFAYTPPIADWDSLLTSESLTFALFALQLALLAILAHRLSQDPHTSWRISFLIGTWLLVVFLWTFLRDTNLYCILADIFMILALSVLPAFRKQKYLIAITIVLAAMFLLGWLSSSKSSRAWQAMTEVFSVVVLPNPARVEFMQARGMPPPDSLEYPEWFRLHAKDAYLQYLIQHPGYAVVVVIRDLMVAFDDNGQPYFNTGNLPWRRTLAPLGDLLHPESPIPFFLDLLVLFGICGLAVIRRIRRAAPWAWLATWLFLAAFINIAVVILGDSLGLTRHALLATTAFRFFMWFFLIVLIDLALMRPDEDFDAALPAPETPAAPVALT